MTDLQVQDRVVSDNGQSHRGMTNTTPATADPPPRAPARTSQLRTRSGRSLIRMVELATIVVLVFLTLDFVLHATGALNVGVAAVSYSVGSFLASPFVGIFKTTSAAQGNLLVWTDVLAMGVYALAAVLVSVVLAKVAGSLVKRTA
jgi:hypothetical protein